jgi:hypothetical protein
MALASRPPIDPATERAARATRIAAMLDRWAAEDVAAEPDWDVTSVERLHLTRPLDGPEPAPTATR